MPPVNYIETFLPSRPSREARPPGLPAYYRLTAENSRGAWPGISKYNCKIGWDCLGPTLVPMDPYGKNSRWIEISSGGPKDVEFSITSNVSWLTTDMTHGKVTMDGKNDKRFHISVDWDKVPSKHGKVHTFGGGVTVAGSDGSNVTVDVPITTAIAPPTDFHGFVEGDGYVVMEAAHFSRNASAEGYAFENFEWYGRTLSGLEMLPVSDKNFTVGTGPSLAYDFWVSGASGSSKDVVEVTIQIGPTFNFMLGKKLAFAVQIDDAEPKMFTPIPDTTELEHAGTVPPDWMNVVASEIRNVTGTFELARGGGGGGAGKHTITLYGMTAGIIVERVWLDFGGVVERGYSYLGPPESRRV